MAGKRQRENTGNYISEWFGFRIYSRVTPTAPLVTNILRSICPFLSELRGAGTVCVKEEHRISTMTAEDGSTVRVKEKRSTGVCTINSPTGGVRQDWINCPYRILQLNLVTQCTRRLFDVPAERPVMIIAALDLLDEAVQTAIVDALAADTAVFIFFGNKMGGEISLPPTDGSPEFSFDITLAEIVRTEQSSDVGRYGIIELQTSDFHGSPSHAISDLRKAADLYEDDGEFANELDAHPEWLSNKVEGPNISNIFKRTFYQMMFKFQLVKDQNCAGCALIIPQAVWDSWQRHLGKPELIDLGDGIYRLEKPCETEPQAQEGDDERNAMVEEADKVSWLYVVEPEAASTLSPNPLIVRRIIATDAAAFSYYALEKAPEIAVSKSAEHLVIALRKQIRKYWPNFGTSTLFT